MESIETKGGGGEHARNGFDSFMAEVPIIQKPDHWFAVNGLVSTWQGPPLLNGFPVKTVFQILKDPVEDNPNNTVDFLTNNLSQGQLKSKTVWLY